MPSQGSGVGVGGAKPSGGGGGSSSSGGGGGGGGGGSTSSNTYLWNFCSSWIEYFYSESVFVFGIIFIIGFIPAVAYYYRQSRQAGSVGYQASHPRTGDYLRLTKTIDSLGNVRVQQEDESAPLLRTK